MSRKGSIRRLDLALHSNMRFWLVMPTRFKDVSEGSIDLSSSAFKVRVIHFLSSRSHISTEGSLIKTVLHELCSNRIQFYFLFTHIVFFF